MSALILIIEDDLPSMTLAQYLLDSAGHRTISASNGREGARSALEKSPDLIICDLHLPMWSGYELLAHLQAQTTWRPVPVIAVTASSMRGDRERVLAAGFDGYISKPIVPESFVAQVESYLLAGGNAGP